MSDVLALYEKDGHLYVLCPAPECEIPVDEIFRKDVPEGIPYVVINRSELPSDNDFLEAWEVDFSKPAGVGVGHEKWFAARGIKI
jgi:hypothetical protein